MSSAEPQSAAAASTTTAQETSLLDQMLGQMGDVVEKDRAKEMIAALVEEAMSGTVQWSKSLTHTIRSAMNRLDEVMSKQLAAIMHHNSFQTLEGSWRGLKHLVFSTETSASLKIKLFQASKKELSKDFEKAIEFDQSTLFKKLYTEEFDQPGGEPFGSIVGDFEFTNHPDDIELLTQCSRVGAAGFCPFISSASPKLFGFKDYTDLAKVRDLEKIFLAPEYIKWRAFRDSEDSRFAVLTAPRVLARLPYGKETKPIDEFGYEEVQTTAAGLGVDVKHSDYTWMNCAYVMGANVTRAFAETGWCTAIRGAENGGKVEGLPVHLVESEDGDTQVKCPTEVQIGDRREAELSKLGFLPLCHYKNTDYSVFFGGQTCQKPKKYDTADATANAAISARLPYMFATSRIAHYLKAIARDKIGSFMEREDCETWLRRWIAQYVLVDAKAGAEMKARFPLAEAQIQVFEVPENPGAYRVISHLRPWLQLEELTTSLRMVARIPRAAT